MDQHEDAVMIKKIYFLYQLINIRVVTFLEQGPCNPELEKEFSGPLESTLSMAENPGLIALKAVIRC